MSLTFTDIFCGAGGSSIGLTGAGMELKLAANHWDRAIETHAANFRDADHLCADVNNYDMRRLPKTDILWASPICTEISPAGGRKRRQKAMAGQGDLLEEFGALSPSAFDRTRATAFDVIRATEVHRYKAVLIENVVEFATDWELFDWWLQGMVQLGYNHQIVSVSSAHVGDDTNPWAPQWRDRLYIVFTLKGIPLPDVKPRPIAWCETCSAVVYANQWWKKEGAKVGKYRTQYLYRCPNSACRHAIVEPYVMPASSAIDWSDLGHRIGDRARPLAAATIRRIEAGLRMFAAPTVVRGCGTDPVDSTYLRAWPAEGEPLGTRLSSNVDGIATPPMLVPAGGTWNTMAATVEDPFRTRMVRDMEGLVTPPLVVNTNHDDDRTFPADEAPLSTRSTKIGESIVTAPFIMVNRTHNVARGVDEPLAPVTTGNSHGVVSPEPFVAMLRGNAVARGVDEPLTTMMSGRNHGLIAQEPFVTMLRNNNVARSVSDPLDTLSAAGKHHALTIPPGAFLQKHHGGIDYAQIGHMTKSVGEPMPGIVARPNVSLVIPYRRTVKPTTTAEPLHALSTRDSAALVQAAIDVDDCHFRMLKPREHLRAQRFTDDYIVTGNQGEQTMQAGNAVSANVAQWLAGQVMKALDATSATQ